MAFYICNIEQMLSLSMSGEAYNNNFFKKADAVNVQSHYTSK